MPRIFTSKPGTRESAELSGAMNTLQKMIEEGRSFSGNERNCCFVNTGSGRFATCSAVSGLDFADDGRALVSVDWDQDGDLDLWTSNRNAPRLRLMRNDMPVGSQRFLQLDLQGNGTTCNRDAIGARVVVTLDDARSTKLIRTLRAGDGFLSQSTGMVHFGLGEADVSALVVRWPGGDVESFSGAVANGRFRLVQGTAKAARAGFSKRNVVLAASEQVPAKPGTVRVPLVSLLPLPRTSMCTAFDGSDKRIPYGNGKPTLIVSFASWCSACREELEELTKRKAKLDKAGIEVVALAVDGLGDESTPREAQKLLKHLKFPYFAAQSKPEFAQLMTGYHHMLVALKRPLPVPCSFLVNAKGQMSVIYKGRVSIDQLLSDAADNPETLRERWVRAAPFTGRMLPQDTPLVSLRHQEANVRSAMGTWFANSNRASDAIDYFESALQLEPDFVAANEGLARLMERLKKPDEAIRYYTAAVKKDPQRADLHYNLGNVYARQEKAVPAIQCYENAIKVRPDYKEAHMNLGVVRLAQRQYSLAVRQFEKVLELDPGFGPARQMLQEAKNRSN